MTQKSTKIGKHLWREPPSCLDAAMERKAMEEGLMAQPVFPENDPKLGAYVGFVITEDGYFED